MNPQIEEILKGSYDLHVHASPDSGAERRLDALDTARYAYEAEMAGFVLKSHEYPTTPLAYVLNQMYPGLNVAGAIALNRAVGGLNAHAVEVSAKLGARVVWMPTFDAHGGMSRAGGGPGIVITDEDGHLKSEVSDILDIIKEHDMVLASGHVSPAEAITLFREAKNKGITRMIATHPGGIATMDEHLEMASLGAYLEHTFLSCMPDRARLSVQELVATLRELGTEQCVVTTDFGQWMNPPAAEGMRMAIAALLGAGMEASEVATLVKGNPNQLIN